MIKDDKSFQEQVSASYEQYESFKDTFSLLLMGEFSTGKTTMLGTGPKPILIDAFDPRSHVVLREQIEKGEVLLRPWWGDSDKKPAKFEEWNKQWEKDISSGFINRFGTYGIDSLTTMIFSIESRMRYLVGKTLSFTDYRRINNIIKNVVEYSQSTETTFIMTAHTKIDRDDATGEIQCVLNAYPYLQTNLPLHFSEKYVMLAKSKAGKRIHSVLTGYRGRYKAGTQLGRNKFDIEEEADLKVLLKKAGYDYEDKPLLKR